MKQGFYPTGMESDMRIDKYLSESCLELSRPYIQKPLRSGQAPVNKKGAKASYVVSEDGHIELEVPATVGPEIEAEAMDLDILYEDRDIILINKPKGAVVHPAADYYSHTLVDGPMYHCKDQLSGINGVMRPGTTHRIDMDIIGVLIACKNDTAHNSIIAQLKEHSVTERYQVVVHGVIKEEERTVVTPIGYRQAERKKICIDYGNGRSTITHYRVLQRFSQFIYVRYHLGTEWTHQIRVHMASLYHPLLGGHVYGPARCPVSGLTGQTPHAGILGIVHPRTREYMEFTALPPECFGKLPHTLR